MLKDKKLGFIGIGNMGSAILTGLSKKIDKENLSIFDTDKDKADKLSKTLKANISTSIESLTQNSDIIVIAVKPDTVPEVLKKMKDSLKPGSIIISIAAGVNISSIEKIIDANINIIRVMPNTPSIVGEGMSVLSPGKNISEDDIKIAEFIFSNTGRVLVLPEKLMDAVTGVSGSGPAYVFTFIQAMADGAVKLGIPRDKAVVLAAQTVLGSAKLVLESSEDPISLRGKVTSPGGTTIDAVHTLEKSGFSGIVMDAIETAALKSKKLGENNA